MEIRGVHIIGLGGTTSIGRTMWAAAAAARAGLCGFSEHPFMIDTAGEPMRVAMAPWLDPNVAGVPRYCSLLLPAIDEAVTCLRDDLQRMRARFSVALALPPNRPGRPVDLVERLGTAVASEYAFRFKNEQAFDCGHAAGHLALATAVDQVAIGQVDACLVAGVDSYIAPETLEWIEARDQLHGGGLLNNAWGFIPGEAASAILVASYAVAQRLDVQPYGELVAVGLGHETITIKADGVCIGEGLTQAFRAGLEHVPAHEQIDNVFCDLNGEPYRADEYGFTALRTKNRFRCATDFVAPADCWGDVGAAGVPLHTALALISHRKRYARGPLSMVWASSESGQRGAAVIRAGDA